MDGDADIPFGPPQGETPSAPVPPPPPIQVTPDAIEPLVVPDIHAVGVSKVGGSCKATAKSGRPCGWRSVFQDSNLCQAHDPRTANSERWAGMARKRKGTKNPEKVSLKKLRGLSKVKTKEDLLRLLSYRIDRFIAKFGDLVTPEVEESICNMIRTYAVVMRVELADDGLLGLPNLSLQRRQA